MEKSIPGERFERSTPRSTIWCSNQLSYPGKVLPYYTFVATSQDLISDKVAPVGGGSSRGTKQPRRVPPSNDFPEADACHQYSEFEGVFVPFHT